MEHFGAALIEAVVKRGSWWVEADAEESEAGEGVASEDLGHGLTRGETDFDGADQLGRVVGVDASPTMIALADKRLDGKAKFLVADLDMPLDMFQANSFDMILSALALDYVRDWSRVFTEFHRVLRAGGQFIFSCQHPLSDYVLNKADDYMQTELYSARFRSIDPKLHVPTYRRPLHLMLNTIVNTGFVFDQFIEAQPAKKFREQFPEQYDRLMRRPDFIIIKSHKP